MGFYGPHVLINDGKRHGVEVFAPDINASGADCSVEESPSHVAKPFQARTDAPITEVGNDFITSVPDFVHPRDTLVFTAPKRAEMQRR
jgi:DNA polymerase III alpha subunit